MNNIIYLEQIVSSIHKGLFNSMIEQWNNGTDRAIINFLYNNKCSIKDVADFFELDEQEVKERLKNIAEVYDKMNTQIIRESFSKRGR